MEKDISPTPYSVCTTSGPALEIAMSVASDIELLSEMIDFNFRA
jgi:hypothetical protein